MGVLCATQSNWMHPTSELIIKAQDLKKSTDFIDREICSRTVAISAIGCSTIESIGELAVAGTLMTCAAIRTPVCYGLRALFVATWVVIGVLCEQALVKSPIRWVQFVVLQVMLGFNSPGHWVAQWKLWARILHSMGEFANGCAAYADQIERAVDRVASWEHGKDHLKRASSLAIFAITATAASASPERLASKYQRAVEPLRHRGGLLSRIGLCLYQHRRLVATTTLLAAGAIAHLNMPGAAERVELAKMLTDEGLKHAGTAFTATKDCVVWSADKTLGEAWRYLTNKPDFHQFNAAIKELRDELAHIKAQR
ncbi:MAG: hypothetical protein Q8K75_08455 [Chlamydiales bacterium]|nr:hypothetical protein [Chlamydiales bacterium]